MDYIPRPIADRFASAFAGEKAGFSAKQITDYFSRYSNLVRPFDQYGMKPSRKELFIDSLYSLQPRSQYFALNNLVTTVHTSKNPYPDVTRRMQLRETLHNFISPNPVGLAFSAVSEPAYREDWIQAYRAITTDPPGAITAARTMLETILKTIISERDQKPVDAGDIGALLRQGEAVLSFVPGRQQAEH